MANKNVGDEAELNTDASRIRGLYQRFPKEEFSKETEMRVMSTAQRHVSRHRKFNFRTWAGFLRRPVITAAVLIVGISVAMYAAQRPGFVFFQKSPELEQFKEMETHINALVEKVRTVKEMQPVSKKWKTEVDELIQREGTQIDDYEAMLGALEKEGSNTEDAEKVRKLSGDLRELFEKRDPNWITKLPVSD